MAMVLCALGLIAFFGHTFATDFDFFHDVCREDGIVENAQFAGFFAASLLGAWLSFHAWRRKDYWIAVPYTAFALGCFFIAGEELCWAQRILDYKTPERLKAINCQRETTFHNIKDVQKNIFYIYALVCGYACLSGALRLLPRLKKNRLFLYYTVHPVCFLYFLPGLVYGLFRIEHGLYWRALKRSFPHGAKKVSVMQEPPELGMALGFFLISLTALLMYRAEKRPTGADS